MSPSSIASILGLVCAGLLASRFDGVLAQGIVGGYLFGAGVALTAGLWLRHVIDTRPERALRGLLDGFGMILVAMILATLCLRFVDSVGTFADWRAFMLAYAVAALLGLFSTTWENSRILLGGGGVQ